MRYLRHARSLLDGTRTLAYVGWLGFENAGDEAMFEALARALKPRKLLVDLPRSERIRWITKLTRRTLYQSVLLGGGTLIGWPAYREAVGALRVAQSPFTSVPAMALGIGAEDPDFIGHDPTLRNSLRGGARQISAERAIRDEIERWAELLAGFTVVGVRGPRTQQILKEAGLEVEIVGDPALLFENVNDAPSFRDNHLGLNIGVSRAMWGTMESLIDEISLAMSSLVSLGWTITLFPVWPPDEAIADQLVRRAGSSKVTVFRGYGDIDYLLERLKTCHVFVGQKLHSVILANAVGVPAVMLAYQPKCFDYHASVRRTDFSIRTDQVQSHAVVGMVREIADKRERQVELMNQRVGELRTRLRAGISGIANAVDVGNRS